MKSSSSNMNRLRNDKFIDFFKSGKSEAKGASMFVLQSYPWAVVFCVITMFCWGSWANTQKLAKKGWRFELFYWDYTIGVLLLTLVFGLTLGAHGASGRPFLADLAQVS